MAAENKNFKVKIATIFEVMNIILYCCEIRENSCR
jgi:hypothetical protein